MKKITLNDFAVMTPSYQQYSFDYVLDSLQSIGIRNIDFWGGIPHFYRFDYTNEGAAAFLKELRQKAEDRGMKFVIYTPETLAYPYSIADPNRKTVQRTIDFFSMSMDDALTLGTDRLFINTGAGLRDLPRQQSMDICIDAIARICAEAEKKGITMMLEQLQPYESNLCTTIEDIALILKAVDSPALKVCVDLVAMDVAGETLEQYFERFGEEKIGFIHFSDAHHEICGTGNLPLKEYIETLERHDYSSIVDLEINDSIYWFDPHAAHKQTVDYLRTFIPER
ncbi:MAG: sugar phosphate isomerase/epimerase family protein [Erysipelotrichaceae bacterium]|nr:sugar phosphate isomerase/epimerase family protein [Erysipelotrichaceae bacterium]